MARRSKPVVVVFDPGDGHHALFKARAVTSKFAIQSVATLDELQAGADRKTALAVVWLSPGDEALSALRALRRLAADVVVLAVSDRVPRELAQAAGEAGANGVFAVPTESPESVASLLSLAHEVSSLRARESELESQAEARRAELAAAGFLDSVTGAYNERFLTVRLTEETQRARRYGRPLALGLLDVDGYRGYVERHGPQLADYMIRQLASVIRTSTRPSDCLCRVAADEFAVVLPETPLSGAITVAEKLRLGVEDFAFARSKPGEVTCSVGCGDYAAEMTCVEDLLRSAEAALHEAKVRGKNQVRW
jgi:diguanylate cyclase (GGDEF)-like protein